MEDGKVYFVFPALGKTYYCENNNDAIELKSEMYHWIDYCCGEGGKGRMNKQSPNWPINYLSAIIEAKRKYKYVFITNSGRMICQKNGIEYSVIYPNIEMKQYIIDRMRKRGNVEDVIINMDNNYEKYINDLENDTFAKEKIVLVNNGYLSDIMELGV